MWFLTYEQMFITKNIFVNKKKIKMTSANDELFIHQHIESISDKTYKDIVRKKNIFTKDLLKATEIVATFIKQYNHVIVGGQAIDFALRLKGAHIYDDDTIPDYDIVSPNFHSDAYILANILIKHDLSNISVINALHPSTMKVKVNFEVVCDITYVPENIYQMLPTLNYRGFQIIHPSFQFIDQHRALSHPYEGAPYITILHRLEKDMKRHDLLYGKYPFTCGIDADCSIASHCKKKTSIDIKYSDLFTDLIKYEIPTCQLLKNSCLSGYVALLYWLTKAHQLGFKSSFKLDKSMFDCIFNEDQIVCSIPKYLYGITVCSDALFDLIEKIQKHYPDMKFQHKYKNAVLDKIRRKVIMEHITTDTKTQVQWEIFDTKGLLLSAHKPWSDCDVWFGNIQLIMQYASTYYWLFSCNKKQKTAHKAELYKFIYILCRELVEWAANRWCQPSEHDNHETYKLFLPTEETYGQYNWSDRYRLSKQRFRTILQETDPPLFKILPKAAYPPPGALIDLNDPMFIFEPEKSEFFQLDGKTQSKPFQPIILAD